MDVLADPIQRAFLGVERSVSGQRWVSRLDQAGQNRALAISQVHGYSELIARVLAGRGVGLDDAAAFLEPTLRALMPDPDTLTDGRKAAERLADAIRRREKVVIFGDYDVDGAASSALMARFLRHFDITAEIYIPDRIFEGYGPNPQAIDQLIERGSELIVTVDCGSTSHEALAVAAERRTNVVVIDHHQVGSVLPPCHALVNPNREDDLSGQGHLCAAGVVYLVLVNTLRVLRLRGDPRAASFDLLSLLDLVALATVCDVVPLKGLNRAYVVKGLLAARHMGNAGLAALLRKAAIGGPVTPYHLGFLLGPRINAGGRIGDAALGSRLLTLDDAAAAEAIASQLDELNRDRQAMEAAMLAEAEAEVLAEYGTGEGASVIVTARQNWHPGIVGLIAARIKEKFRRPAFAIAFDPNGRGTGSGRSINGFDMGRLVRAAVDNGLLVKGGGHAMAAGLTVERGKLGQLRQFFEERAETAIRDLVAVQTLKVDGALAAAGATLDLVDLLDQAGPYGSGHPQPLFAFPQHRLRDSRQVGANHVKVTLEGQDGSRMEGIAFRAMETPLGDFLLGNRGATVHVAGSVSADLWQGTRKVQLRVTDAAKAN
ncbi:single-stranded-DNA-specific exonuclease RecJ [Sinorhizobium meliloti WSM1022]|jgi:single-stranded-DNA-specific exonuclease|uniref:single-stranded-DNA-specific exonuclease RecJ n=2 Tax=Rhizobium meliloti TaxID=382 RepID=UPI0004073E06|nr:single-stranded-DNA-specific exonuclease RecJ [Sinorhizobium meliloti]ASQ03976.1 single-stranded-DNA-specific exonuclease RecJ [Sinorhizobium meliloti]MCO6424634.1 single-stranded-DNA-specific exonuclease RecJ [Sinorhizobium meliloti]MDW9409476.1 single-stranded-DNA-specific exonuclease RecJ [Sinorhizobium meliloti]MDW9442858.1 single-stranded-DNA-specific exonuclease RecJ [Sinorhizobium meliloti]MDW9454632.1 single-stranded-DNA-specific exonuclease RecJ [Sinorhizobium meliloti]